LIYERWKRAQDKEKEPRGSGVASCHGRLMDQKLRPNHTTAT